ncbi:MAG: ABC transporter ATP-binding protein [Bacillota bacterium]|jgi:ABC-2 type transport system ATP-binding protein
MIEVKNLTKYYGNTLSVDNISFSVEKGKIYGFLGPNGAGKSTTMNIITGYIGATSGQVIVNGYDILAEPENARKSIGYLPEIPPLYTDMTVSEYLFFAAALKKIPKINRKMQVEEIIKMTHIQDVSNRLIKNLSKGYKQRVGLAQAILGFPEVIILDEPTVGLDPKQILEIRDLIKQLAQNHTVILSSHILSEVRALCDYILIIHKGRLIASDTPDNLEKALKGTNQLELTVKGQIDAVKSSLNKIRSINRQSFFKNHDGTVNIYLDYSRELDLREEIFYTLAQDSCPILMMKSTETSLEKIFLELTENDHAVPLVKTNIQNQTKCQEEA